MSSQRRPVSSAARTPRGPLPPGIYWRRRAFVLVLAFALVLVIGRWLTGASDGGEDETPAVRQAGAEVSATQTVTVGTETGASAGPGDGPSDGQSSAAGAPSPTVPAAPTLAAPEGVCAPADVVVTPAVAPSSAAGGDVALTLSLQTLSAEACTWQVSADSVVVRIARNGKEIWTTRHCSQVVPSESVVVRRTVASVVSLTWNARESDPGCTRRTEWVPVGDYSIAAAALGGEPREASFTLVAPAPRTVEVTEQPKKDKKQGKKPKKPVN